MTIPILFSQLIGYSLEKPGDINGKRCSALGESVANAFSLWSVVAKQPDLRVHSDECAAYSIRLNSHNQRVWIAAAAASLRSFVKFGLFGNVCRCILVRHISGSYR